MYSEKVVSTTFTIKIPFNLFTCEDILCTIFWVAASHGVLTIRPPVKQLSRLFPNIFCCSLKMTVMDRLVAELGGIETAIVTLQEQV